MFGITGVYLRIAEFVVLIAFLFGAYYWVGDHAVTEYKQEQAVLQAKADKIQQSKYDDLAADYATLRATRTVQYKTITKTVEKLVDRPVYKNQCVDEQGLEVINKALSGGGNE